MEQREKHGQSPPGGSVFPEKWEEPSLGHVAGWGLLTRMSCLSWCRGAMTQPD